MRRGWSTTWDHMWRYNLYISTHRLYFVFILKDSHNNNNCIFTSLSSRRSRTRPAPPGQCTRSWRKPWQPSWSLPPTSSRATSSSRWQTCTFSEKDYTVYDNSRHDVHFLLPSNWCLSALQYSWYFFEALVKSMAQYLIESCKVKVSVCHNLCVLTLGVSLQVGFMTAEVVYSRPGLVGSRSTTDRVLWPVSQSCAI